LGKCQKFELEFAYNNMLANDDWNYWWYYNFDKYQLITGRHFNNILEVGWGPHTNLKYILPCIKLM
jgi:hypothetical protein